MWGNPRVGGVCSNSPKIGFRDVSERKVGLRYLKGIDEKPITTHSQRDCWYWVGSIYKSPLVFS